MLLLRNISNLKTKRYLSQGFTLAEMAVVVMLMGIMLTMGIGMLRTQMERTAYEVTQKKQQTIKDALTAYLRTNWRLPCPDTNFAAPGPDGSENRLGAVTTACSATFGVLPFVTLGLPREIALDGWNNYFSYHVVNWTITSNFDPAGIGSLVVNSAPATPITSNAVIVLVSHGKNGNGAYTVKGARRLFPTTADPLAVDEQENINQVANKIYFKREYTDVAAAIGGSFDDVVMFIQAEDLLTPLRSDGSLKIQTDAMQSMQNAVVAQSLLTCTLPVVYVPVGQVYGSNVTYARLFAAPISLAATPTTENIFSFTVGNVTSVITLNKISWFYVNYGKCP